LTPQGTKYRRILREEIQSTRQYYRVLLNASDAIRKNSHLTLSASDVVLLRQSSVTTPHTSCLSATLLTAQHKQRMRSALGMMVEVSIRELAATEYGRSARVIASDEIKARILEIGINKCARESGLHRANFIRKLVRGATVKRNSYTKFLQWLGNRKIVDE